ncbi:MAG: hypothetical protein ABTQ34_05040 [Bdellovibrionales bacterium]
MFPSLKGALGGNAGAGEGSQTDKILSALDPVIAENWPKIAPVAEPLLAKAQSDEAAAALARALYPWLPAVMRMVVKEEAFVDFVVKNKGPVLEKLKAASQKA